MGKEKVIAILDIGKTNKKFFLFDKNYRIVYQKALSFALILDEDGNECENLPAVEQFLLNTIKEVLASEKYTVEIINFSTYGASLVHIGLNGKPVAKMDNYLTPYPNGLLSLLFAKDIAKLQFELETCCPIQGNLNAGLQLLRLYHLNRVLFDRIENSLFLPQYFNYLLTQRIHMDMTSIGCHTSLWDFDRKRFHRWIEDLGIESKLAPIRPNDHLDKIEFEGQCLSVGIGIHDSSAALVPYLKIIKEPFLLVSTGTWSVTLNPFNEDPLTEKELKDGCLCYISYLGNPVKASRVFLGSVYERELNRLLEHFNIDKVVFNSIGFDVAKWNNLQIIKDRNSSGIDILLSDFPFSNYSLGNYSDYTMAYYQLIYELVKVQSYFIQIVDPLDKIKNLFVDGGFGHNKLFVQGLAQVFPRKKVYAAEVPQSTAIGAALVLHEQWNQEPIVGNNIVKLERFSPIV